MPQKQLTALPTATDAADDDLLIKRDTSSGTDEKLPISVLRDPILDRANHTGTQPLSTISDAGTAAANDTTDFAQISGGSNANFTTMPQVGGAPIVESGSNSDGEWVRYADGTQSCRGVHTADITDINFWIATLPLPASYITLAGSVAFCCVNGDSSYWTDPDERRAYSHATMNSTGYMNLGLSIDVGSLFSGNAAISWHSYGKWF